MTALWRPGLVTLFPASDGHEGVLRLDTVRGPLLVELRRWNKRSGHVALEWRCEIGADTPDAAFDALAEALAGRAAG